MDKEDVSKAARTTGKNSAAAQRSSVQTVKQPWKKQHAPRCLVKSHHSQRRPTKSGTQQKPGQGRIRLARGLDAGKRAAPQSQASRMKACYRSLKGSLAKLSLECKAGGDPPKTTKKQKLGQSNRSGMNAGERTAPNKGVGKAEHSQPPPAEKAREFSSTTENQRKLKPTTMEKRRYQAVSEYQFIYPGKAAFHCTRETVRQHLRSIYLGDQEKLKPTRISRSQWDVNEAQRGDPSTDNKCSTGSDLLRKMHQSSLPHGLSSLTYRINKLVLVSKNVQPPSENPPCTPAGSQGIPQPCHPPAPEKLSPPTEAFQPSGFPERNESNEVGSAHQGCGPDLSLQGDALTISPACSGKSLRPRAMSAKDWPEKALKRASGEEGRNGTSARKEDVARGTLAFHASNRPTVAHSQSAIVVPNIARLSSDKSADAEVACANAPPFLSEARTPTPPCIAVCQPAAREEKLPGAPAQQPCGEKGQAYPGAGITTSKAAEMDTW